MLAAHAQCWPKLKRATHTTVLVSDICSPATHASAVDCVTGSWSSFGNCSVSCGSGFKTRSREILVESVGDGKACGPVIDTAECLNMPCPGEKCLVSIDV